MVFGLVFLLLADLLCFFYLLFALLGVRVELVAGVLLHAIKVILSISHIVGRLLLALFVPGRRVSIILISSSYDGRIPGTQRICKDLEDVGSDLEVGAD